MKRSSLIAVVLLPSFCFAQQPRFPNPKSPDEIWQNDRDLLDGISNTKIGVITGMAACPGCIGETLKSTLSGVFQNFPTSTHYGDLTSLNLTAGDYSITGEMTFINNGATATSSIIGVSITTGDSGAGLVDGDTQIGVGVPIGANGISGVVAARHFIFSVATTVYLKYEATYSVGTPQATGSLTAVRIR